MGSFGKLEEFDPEQGHDSGQYTERLQQYFVKNDIDNGCPQTEGIHGCEKTMLSACGGKTYKLVCNLIVYTGKAR